MYCNKHFQKRTPYYDMCLKPTYLWFKPYVMTYDVLFFSVVSLLFVCRQQTQTQDTGVKWSILSMDQDLTCEYECTAKLCQSGAKNEFILPENLVYMCFCLCRKRAGLSGFGEESSLPHSNEWKWGGKKRNSTSYITIWKVDTLAPVQLQKKRIHPSLWKKKDR